MNLWRRCFNRTLSKLKKEKLEWSYLQNDKSDRNDKASEWNYLHNEKAEVDVDSRLQIETHSTGREKDAQLCVYVGEQKVVDL